MTPLAHRIVSELTLPKKDRRFYDLAGLLPMMDDIHCFECSEVFELAFELFGEESKLPALEKAAARYSFLPAPRTWVEYLNTSTGTRHGLLLVEEGDTIKGFQAFGSASEFYSIPFYFLIPHIRNKQPDYAAQVHPIGSFPVRPGDLEDRRRVEKLISETQDYTQNAAFLMPALLAFINTPRVIGRRQHMPHAGLQRKLAHARGTVGKYPLHAWHEVKLDIAPARLDPSATGEPHETRLTGARARHFVRCHLRVRLGALELVSPHWRGDPALGIKQTRYRVTNTRPELEPV